jgi:hypothetical protein
MALARWQATITDEEGNVVPGAMIQVRREAAGLPLVADLKADVDGVVPLGNPFAADADGFAFFHVRGFRTGYRIRAYDPATGFDRTWKNVPVGTAAAVDTDQLGIGVDPDVQVNTLADRAAYNSQAAGYTVLVSDIGDGRAAIYTRVTGTPGVWSDPAVITGPQGVGTGLSFDVVVANLTERATYDTEDEGFVVLVSNSGDGRAAVYTKLSDSSGDWSDPNYLAGDRFDLTLFVADNPYSEEMVLRHIFTNSVTFAAGLVGSLGKAVDAADGEAIFLIKKNGSTVGDITFDESTEATFNLLGGQVFDAGDVIEIFAPVPQDATLFQVAITLAGFRSPAP